MEGEPMINPPDVAIFTAQAMSGFAVGIVGNQVKSAICLTSCRCCSRKLK